MPQSLEEQLKQLTGEQPGAATPTAEPGSLEDQLNALTAPPKQTKMDVLAATMRDPFGDHRQVQRPLSVASNFPPPEKPNLANKALAEQNSEQPADLAILRQKVQGIDAGAHAQPVSTPHQTVATARQYTPLALTPQSDSLEYGLAQGFTDYLGGNADDVGLMNADTDVAALTRGLANDAMQKHAYEEASQTGIPGAIQTGQGVIGGQQAVFRNLAGKSTDEQFREEALGASADTAEGIGGMLTPLIALAFRTNPLRTAAALEISGLASEYTIDKLKELGASENQQRLAGALAGFLPLTDPVHHGIDNIREFKATQKAHQEYQKAKTEYFDQYQKALEQVRFQESIETDPIRKQQFKEQGDAIERQMADEKAFVDAIEERAKNPTKLESMARPREEAPAEAQKPLEAQVEELAKPDAVAPTEEAPGANKEQIAQKPIEQQLEDIVATSDVAPEEAAKMAEANAQGQPRIATADEVQGHGVRYIHAAPDKPGTLYVDEGANKVLSELVGEKIFGLGGEEGAAISVPVRRARMWLMRLSPDHVGNPKIEPIMQALSDAIADAGTGNINLARVQDPTGAARPEGELLRRVREEGQHGQQVKVFGHGRYSSRLIEEHYRQLRMDKSDGGVTAALWDAFAQHYPEDQIIPEIYAHLASGDMLGHPEELRPQFEKMAEDWISSYWDAVAKYHGPAALKALLADHRLFTEPLHEAVQTKNEALGPIAPADKSQPRIPFYLRENAGRNTPRGDGQTGGDVSERRPSGETENRQSLPGQDSQGPRPKSKLLPPDFPESLRSAEFDPAKSEELRKILEAQFNMSFKDFQIPKDRVDEVQRKAEQAVNNYPNGSGLAYVGIQFNNGIGPDLVMFNRGTATLAIPWNKVSVDAIKERLAAHDEYLRQNNGSMASKEGSPEFPDPFSREKNADEIEQRLAKWRNFDQGWRFAVNELDRQGIKPERAHQLLDAALNGDKSAGSIVGQRVGKVFEQLQKVYADAHSLDKKYLSKKSAFGWDANGIARRKADRQQERQAAVYKMAEQGDFTKFMQALMGERKNIEKLLNEPPLWWQLADENVKADKHVEEAGKEMDTAGTLLRERSQRKILGELPLKYSLPGEWVSDSTGELLNYEIDGELVAGIEQLQDGKFEVQFGVNHKTFDTLAEAKAYAEKNWRIQNLTALDHMEVLGHDNPATQLYKESIQNASDAVSRQRKARKNVDDFIEMNGPLGDGDGGSLLSKDREIDTREHLGKINKFLDKVFRPPQAKDLPPTERQAKIVQEQLKRPPILRNLGEHATEMGDFARKTFVDRLYAWRDAVNDIRKMGVDFKPEENPDFILDLVYGGTKGIMEAEMLDIKDNVVEPASKAKLLNHVRAYLNLHGYRRAFGIHEERMSTVLRKLERANYNAARAEGKVAGRYRAEARELAREYDDLVRQKNENRVANAQYKDIQDVQKELDEMKAELGDDKFKKIEGYANVVWRMNRRAWDMMRGNIISEEVYQQGINRGIQYVPLTRIIEDLSSHDYSRIQTLSGSRLDLKKQTSLQRFVGSPRLNQDPLATSVNNFARIVQEVQRSRAGKVAVGALQKSKLENIVAELEEGQKPRPGFGTIAYYEMGEKKNFEVPLPLAEALDVGKIYVFPKFLETILGAGKSAFQAGAVGLSLPFTISNFFRDQKEAMMFSKGMSGNNPLAWAKSFLQFEGRYARGLWASLRKNERYREVLRAQALYGTLQKTIDPERYLLFEKSLIQKFNPIIKVKEVLGDISGAVEEATKIATYESMIAQGADPVTAAIEARRRGGSPDFAVGGDAKQVLDMLLMFQNARIQGWRRSWTEWFGFKNHPLVTASMMATAYAFYLHNMQYTNKDGEPDWYHIPKDIRNNNWIILTPWTYQDSDGVTHRSRIEIAKDHPSQIAWNVIEGTLDKLYDENGVYTDSWRNTAYDQLSQNWLPLPLKIEEDKKAEGILRGLIASSHPFARVLAEQLWGDTGKQALTGIPIVSAKLAQRVSTEQYDEKTSPTAVLLAQKFAKLHFPAAFTSPERLEHMIRGTLATLGQQGLDISDIIQRKGLPAPTMDLMEGDEKWANIPFFGSFTSRVIGGKGDEQARRRSQKFYDHLRQAEQIKRTVDGLAKEGKMERVSEILDDPKSVVYYLNYGTYAQGQKELAAYKRAIEQLQAGDEGSMKAFLSAHNINEPSFANRLASDPQIRKELIGIFQAQRQRLLQLGPAIDAQIKDMEQRMKSVKTTGVQ